jgi:hypothetical protein
MQQQQVKKLAVQAFSPAAAAFSLTSNFLAFQEKVLLV